jgi:hypothetical protein
VQEEQERIKGSHPLDGTSGGWASPANVAEMSVPPGRGAAARLP